MPGRGGGRGPVQEAPAAVLRLEPLAAVHPHARAALDPVRGGTRDAQRLRDRGGEQVARAGGHHLAVDRDHVHRAGAQVDHGRVGARTRGGERTQARGGGLGEHAVHRDPQQACQHGRVVAAGQPAQRRDQRRGAQAPPPRGGRVRHLGQVEREQVVEFGPAVRGAEGTHGADRPAANLRARGPQRDPLARDLHPRPGFPGDTPRPAVPSPAVPPAAPSAGRRCQPGHVPPGAAPAPPRRRGRPRRWRSRRAYGTAPPRPPASPAPSENAAASATGSASRVSGSPGGRTSTATRSQPATAARST